MENTLKNYKIQIQKYSEILNMIETHKFIFTDDIIINEMNNIPTFNLDTEIFIFDKNSHQKKEIFDFDKLKFELTKPWIIKKKEYLLIYEFLKLMYFIEKPVSNNIPLTNHNNIIYKLQQNIFTDLFPNQEIIFIYYMNKILSSNQVNKTDIKSFFSSIFLSENCLLNKDPTLFDSYFFFNNIPDNNQISEYFYDFGPDFINMVNIYNTVIKIINSLSTTIPTIIIKPFALSPSEESFNIYQNTKIYQFSDIYFPAFLDPNFKKYFCFKNN